MVGLTASQLKEIRYGNKKMTPWQKYMRKISQDWIKYQEQVRYVIELAARQKDMPASELLYDLAYARNEYKTAVSKPYLDFINEQCTAEITKTAAVNNVSLSDLMKLADKEKREKIAAKKTKFSAPTPHKIKPKSRGSAAQ